MSMKSNPLLSVIVPIYNTAEFLPECLDSILNQTYQNLEVICINDGSTDNSLSLLDEYASKDSRIIIINKPNGGSSSARNAGIDIAKGDYITFVDSDDVVQLDTYEKNIQYFIEDDELEMIIYPIYTGWMSGTGHLWNLQAKKIKETAEIFFFIWQNNAFTNSFCNKIFKMEVFSGRRFPEGQKFEDQYLIPKIAQNTGKCYISQTGTYFYRYRKGSVMHSRYDYKKSKDLILACIELYKEGTLVNPYIDKAESLSFLLKNVYWFLVHYFRNYTQEEQDYMIEIIKPYPIKFGLSIRALFSKQFSLREKCRLFTLSTVGLKNTYKLFSYIENNKK